MNAYPTEYKICKDHRVRHDMIGGRLSLSTEPLIGKTPKIFLVGQDPTVTRGCAPVVFDLDRQQSTLAKWIGSELLSPLDLTSKEIYATNAVKCCFPRLPRKFAAENSISLIKFLSPFFNHCKEHFIKELQSFTKYIHIGLGEPVHQLLISSFNWDLPLKMKSAFGAHYSVTMQDKRVRFLPCMHFNTWKLKPFYKKNWESFINASRGALSQTCK